MSLYLQLLDQLHSMCDSIESEFEYVGLPADSKLYGRDEELKKLRSYLDFDNDVNTRCKIALTHFGLFQVVLQIVYKKQ